MFREAIKLIQETANEAQTAKVLAELNTDGRTAHVQIGGNIQQIALQPRPRSHEVRSLQDLILYARRIENTRPIVWHDFGGVLLVLDDADRRDYVLFPLGFSERFATLRKLAKDKPVFQQPQFIRLLRIELGLDPIAVVAKFRKLDFNMTTDGTGEVNHANQRVSKAVAARVSGVDELPEELDVSVPVYQQTGERTEYMVRCAVEIDTINRVFQLVPLADELERVLDLAQADIHARLATALAERDGQFAIPMYNGKP